MTFFQKLRALFASTAPQRDMPPPPASYISPADPPPPPPPPPLLAPWFVALIADVRQCESVPALIEYTAHRSGYIREAALRRGDELAVPELLPSVIARLNDWVPPIRGLAREILFRVLPTLDAEAVLRLLPGLQRLRGTTRVDHSSWMQTLEQMCIVVIGPERLLTAVFDPDVVIARACYRLLDDYKLVPPSALLSWELLNGNDIVLARNASEKLADLHGVELNAMCELGLRAHFGFVRVACLRVVLSSQSEANDRLATAMLIDVSQWVRLMSIAYLTRRGIDSGALYAARLVAPGDNPDVLRAALSGLAEVGGRDYIDIIRPLTQHASARVRAAAFAVWLHLDPANKDEIASLVLVDDARRVRKMMLPMARKQGAFIPIERVMAVLRQKTDVDLMLSYADSDPWLCLEVIVELAKSDAMDPTLNDRLRQALKRWIARAGNVYVRPSDQQCAMFRDVDNRASLLGLLTNDRWSQTRLTYELDQSLQT